MSAVGTAATREFTIRFPEELARQIVAVAEEENRNLSDLFREAFRAYRMERNDRKLIAARADAARRSPNNYTEADVEAFVDEIRSEMYQQRTKTA
jgi:Arc/MetJ-type ribon-helix-helix transcriptional regulator